MMRYKKLIVAVVGLAAILSKDFLGFTIPFAPEAISDTIIAILTAFGVWKATNV